MKIGTIPPGTCELCGIEASYADSIPDANTPGPHHQGVPGYRPQRLCMIHAVERREVATSRVRPIPPRTSLSASIRQSRSPASPATAPSLSPAGTVTGPYPHESAAQDAIDRLTVESDRDIDTESYEIIRVEERL